MDVQLIAHVNLQCAAPTHSAMDRACIGGSVDVDPIRVAYFDFGLS